MRGPGRTHTFRLSWQEGGRAKVAHTSHPGDRQLRSPYRFYNLPKLCHQEHPRPQTHESRLNPFPRHC